MRRRLGREARSRRSPRRPAALAALAVPPCSSATRCTIARPRPEPGLPRASSERQKRSKTLRQVLVRRSPGRGRGPRRVRPPTSISTSPPAGLHLAALSSRLEIARPSRCAVAADQRGGEALARSAARASPPPRALDRVAASSSRRDVLATAPPSLARTRASSTTSATRSVSSSSSSVRSATSRLRSAGVEALAAAERLDVGAQRRQRGAQLVRGVGDQPPLRRLGALERLHHLVEARRQPPQLVVAAHLDAPGQVVGPRHLLGGLRDLAGRGQRGPRDHRARARRPGRSRRR